MVKTAELTSRLYLDKLEFYYGENKILDEVSLDLKKGEIIAFLGKSGSGKSTLLKCISTLLDLENGNAYLDGQQYIENGEILFEPWEIRQKILLVFQEFNLFPNLTVFENVKIALERVRRVSKDEAKVAAIALLEKLEIAALKDNYPNEISGGQAQRVALARALLMQPQVLLLDEITSAIDPTTILNVIKVIDEIRANEATIDTSIIIVTHNIKFAVDYADRIAFLDSGKILEVLDAKNFLDDSTHSIVRDYIKDAKYFI